MRWIGKFVFVFANFFLRVIKSERKEEVYTVLYRMKETSREESGVIGFGSVRRVLRVYKRLRD